MFYGNDPDGKGYSTRAHLAEVVALLGLPPPDLLERGRRSPEFFTNDGTYIDLLNFNLHVGRTHLYTYVYVGKWKADMPLPESTSLEESEKFLEQGKNRELFMAFMRGMLQWRPEDRKTAKELLDDPWLNS